ncbi:MBL fold metallo-hydrolase [Candidatus Woesearchaeota archaeon]|nr:MBL fold metallo-hydrolase [Candidatus Woesearchaeota archaeon]
MKIRILGSGAWEGIPAPFCKCKVCELAKEYPNSKDHRTRPEILVEGDKGKFLIEISPDIRLQSAKFNLPAIRNFLISHWHFDHMYGLMDLHAWSELVLRRKICLHCSKDTSKWLNKNFNHISKKIIIHKPFESFSLYGIIITAIPVYHMYTKDKNLKEDELNSTFGYILEKNKKKVVFLPDYYKLPAKSLKLCTNADLLIVDGTFLFSESFPKKFFQKMILTDKDHLHGKDIFALIKLLKPKKTVFHSISHLTEKSHEKLQNKLPKSIIVSYDGIEFVF